MAEDLILKKKEELKVANARDRDLRRQNRSDKNIPVQQVIRYSFYIYVKEEEVEEVLDIGALEGDSFGNFDNNQPVSI